MKKKVVLIVSLVVLLIMVIGVSYAYFVTRILGGETSSTVLGASANLELTFTDGTKVINATNITPGWSDNKSFTVKNTGNNTAYYVIKITNITNTFNVYGSISYSISSSAGANIAKETLPLMDMAVSGPVEIAQNVTHTYTLTTYYNNLEVNQESDLGASFSYQVEIEGVYKKEIAYIEDLVDLSNSVSNGDDFAHTWFVLTKDLDFNDNSSYRDYTSTSYGDLNEDNTVSDIKTELTDTNGKGFIPIGYSENTAVRFKGSIDGANHSIDNLYIKTNYASGGLFYRIDSSSINNLTISGYVENTVYSAAGLAAISYGNCVINNTHNEATVKSTESSLASAGLVVSGHNSLYIRNSSNSGTITGGVRAGGLVGQLYQSSDNTLVIDNSYNSGDIVGITSSSDSYVGGLLATDKSTTNIVKIYNSYNSGDITNNTNDSTIKRMGGLVGYSLGYIAIYDSYNTGNVEWTWDYTNNTTTTEYVAIRLGGIAGEVREGLLINSYNAGNVTSGSWTGGLLGAKAAENKNFIINKSYNTGSISSSYKNAQSATATSGLVSYNVNGNLYILNSYNVGDVSCKYYGAGIVSRNQGSVYILNSYNAGNINSTLPSSSYHIAGAYSSSSQDNVFVNINNFYNVGNLTGDTSRKYGVAYLDQINYTVNNAYYKEGVSGSDKANITTSQTSSYISGVEFVNLLNNNASSINLSSIDSALATYTLSRWGVDTNLGYPVLNN